MKVLVELSKFLTGSVETKSQISSIYGEIIIFVKIQFLLLVQPNCIYFHLYQDIESMCNWNLCQHGKIYIGDILSN